MVLLYGFRNIQHDNKFYCYFVNEQLNLKNWDGQAFDLANGSMENFLKTFFNILK